MAETRADHQAAADGGLASDLEELLSPAVAAATDLSALIASVVDVLAEHQDQELIDLRDGIRDAADTLASDVYGEQWARVEPVVDQLRRLVGEMSS